MQRRNQRNARIVLLSGLETRGMDEQLKIGIEWITRAVEITGIGIIVIGAFGALFSFMRRLLQRQAKEKIVSDFRTDLGRAILLGLEFLVAADIVHTVAIDPTLDSLAVLAGIVLIRTFLSFSLEVEIEGRWPWQRGAEARAEEWRG
jgi:uncharacterized membrane protein